MTEPTKWATATIITVALSMVCALVASVVHKYAEDVFITTMITYCVIAVFAISVKSVKVSMFDD